MGEKSQTISPTIPPHVLFKVFEGVTENNPQVRKVTPEGPYELFRDALRHLLPSWSESKELGSVSS